MNTGMLMYFLDLLFEVPLEYWHADLYFLDLLFEVPLEYWHADLYFLDLLLHLPLNTFQTELIHFHISKLNRFFMPPSYWLKT